VVEVGWARSLQCDEIRGGSPQDVHLQLEGFVVQRFTNYHVLDDAAAVLSQIERFIKSCRGKARWSKTCTTKGAAGTALYYLATAPRSNTQSMGAGNDSNSPRLSKTRLRGAAVSFAAAAQNAVWPLPGLQRHKPFLFQHPQASPELRRLRSWCSTSATATSRSARTRGKPAQVCANYSAKPHPRPDEDPNGKRALALWFSPRKSRPIKAALVDAERRGPGQRASEPIHLRILSVPAEGTRKAEGMHVGAPRVGPAPSESVYRCLSSAHHPRRSLSKGRGACASRW
jgi:hypothetical protein